MRLSGLSDASKDRKTTGVDVVTLSGRVFQNVLLLKRTAAFCAKDAVTGSLSTNRSPGEVAAIALFPSVD